jgi:hypothetical protein
LGFLKRTDRNEGFSQFPLVAGLNWLPLFLIPKTKHAVLDNFYYQSCWIDILNVSGQTTKTEAKLSTNIRLLNAEK